MHVRTHAHMYVLLYTLLCKHKSLTLIRWPQLSLLQLQLFRRACNIFRLQARLALDMWSSSLVPAVKGRGSGKVLSRHPFCSFFPLFSITRKLSPSFILPRSSYIHPHAVLPSQLWISPFPASSSIFQPLLSLLICLHPSLPSDIPISSILTKWHSHLILPLTNLPVWLHCIPSSFLRSFILLLSTLFVLVIRRTQLFSQTCSFCCCCSVNIQQNVAHW